MTLSSELHGDQLAPHSIEAEEAVLGSCLIDPRAILEVLPFVRAGDFFIVRHGWVWAAMCRLQERHEPIDYLTAVSELEQAGKLAECGGAAYILSLINKTPSALNVEGYGRIVERMAVRRRAINAAQQIVRAAHSDETDVSEMIRQSHHALYEAFGGYGKQPAARYPVADLSRELREEARQWAAHPAHIRGWQCGWHDFDYATGGLQPGWLVIVAGRAGEGKSLILGYVVAGLAINQVRCVIITLETDAREYVRRVAVGRAHVPLTLIQEGRASIPQTSAYDKALADLESAPLTIYDASGPDIPELKGIVERHIMEVGPIDVLAIDTGDLITERANEKSRYVGMSLVYGGLQAWAKASPYCIVVAAQLNRAALERTGGEGGIANIRDTGKAEQDAAIILNLYRHSYHQPDDESDRQHMAWLRVGKHRYRRAGGKIPAYYDGDWPGFAPATKVSVDLWKDKQL